MSKITATKRGRVFERNEEGYTVKRAERIPARPQIKLGIKGKANAYILVTPGEAVNLRRRLKKGSIYENKV
jgi:hypothetical protein